MFSFLSSATTSYNNNILIASLVEIFPEADRDYLVYTVQEYELSKQLMVEKLLEIDLPLVQHQNVKLLTLLELFPNLESNLARELVESNYFNGIDSLLNKDYKMDKNGFDVDEMFRETEYLDALFVYLFKKYPYLRKSTIKRVIKSENGNPKSSFDKLNTQSTILNFNLMGVFSTKTLTSKWEAYFDSLIANHDTTKDLEIARDINQEQYLKLYQCECCFTDTDLDSVYVCGAGHNLCKDCINSNIRIGMYETGNARGQLLKCFAASQKCEETITLYDLEFILEPALFRNYHLALAEQFATMSGAKIVQCPECKYFEELEHKSRWIKILEIVENYLNKASAYYGQYGSDIIRFIFVVSSFLCIFYSLKLFYACYLGGTLAKLLYQRLNYDYYAYLVTKYFKRPEVLKIPKPPVLKCRNLYCGRSTCTNCNQSWRPDHVCFEKDKNSLRTSVELAMSQALIRTCPRCSVRFVKEEGCNKMTCPTCKLHICYKCSQDITAVGYAHFCNHFRPIPGSSCSECDACDLYDKYSQRELAIQAGIQAEQNWRNQHNQTQI